MTKLINFFQRIYTFIRLDIWRITEHELSRTKLFTYRLVKTVVLAVRGFDTHDLNVKASALTYSILFAIVPLFALIIAIGRGFGVEELIENSLKNSFIGQSNMLPTAMGFVKRYLETAQGGVFIGIGFVALFFSIMLFFQQVESAFNDIWQVKKSRSVIRQFTTYFSAILIIPLLIVLSSGFSIYINTALSHSFFYNVISPLLSFVVKFMPYFINWVLFTVLYLVIPNTRVRFLNAMVAGIVAGSAFQLFQVLYISGQVYLSRYNVVYGGFAAIPLLLLWLQISCLITLFGAEISYASQNIKNFEYEVDTNTISTRYKRYLTLFLTHLVVKQFEEQKPPLSSEDIAIKYKLPTRLVNQLLTKLVEASVIIEVYNEQSKSKTYQPAIDINQLTVKLMFNKLDMHGSELFLMNKDELMDEFWQKNLDINLLSEKNTENLLVKDI